MAYETYYYVKDRNYAVTRKRTSWLGIIFFMIGITILGWGGLPILYYEFLQAPDIGQRSLVSPVGYTVEASNGEFQEGNLENATSWFPMARMQVRQQNQVDEYSLTIPSLGIEDAKVIIGSEDLSKSLIHWGGTALPGNNGTAVLFGHSVLPQFFNPRSYTAIFSTLHTIDLGENIFVDYDGITYQYQVVDMFEVKPDEISVLDQNFSDKYMLLITCTPPGTYFRRLVVKTRLVPYASDYHEEAASN